MTDVMKYMAIFYGLSAGIFYLRHIDMFRLALNFYTYFAYRSPDKFYKLYDSILLDDGFIFQCLKNYRFLRTYMNYLRNHEDARPGAYDNFRIYYDENRKLVIKHFFWVFIFPSILFFIWWYYYFITISVVFILSIIYVFAKNPNIFKNEKEGIILLIVVGYIMGKRMAKRDKKVRNAQS